MLTKNGRPPEVGDLLARARTLTPDEIRGLAAGDESAAAVRHAAASRSWALTKLLVALLPERFPDDVAARIAGPWRRIACG
jgi:hypothetical protein